MFAELQREIHKPYFNWRVHTGKRNS